VTYPLTYVCKWCGVAHIGTFPEVRTTEPATLSVCDRPGCRRQAREAYKS
jgi:hypothetical protein